MKIPAISLPFIFLYLLFFVFFFLAMAGDSEKLLAPQDQEPLNLEGSSFTHLISFMFNSFINSNADEMI